MSAKGLTPVVSM